MKFDVIIIGGGAAGLEIDRADRHLGTPPHALVLATSQGRHTDIYLVVCEELLATYPGLGGMENELVRADMVFYETPNGGAVWSSPAVVDGRVIFGSRDANLYILDAASGASERRDSRIDQKIRRRNPARARSRTPAGSRCCALCNCTCR